MVEPIDEFFEKSGLLPITPDDVRRFPRFYFRSCAEATIYPLRPNQPTTQCFVLTRDLSRCGLSLLHNAQLFPTQRIDVVLDGRPPKSLEVVWCHRLDENMYLVGCRFFGSSDSAK
jgi:hypothetical protein